eukprot:c4950_g1_i2 orf=79-285(+)
MSNNTTSRLKVIAPLVHAITIVIVKEIRAMTFCLTKVKRMRCLESRSLLLKKNQIARSEHNPSFSKDK